LISEEIYLMRIFLITFVVDLDIIGADGDGLEGCFKKPSPLPMLIWK
jgi:hypothetical protein